MSRLGEIKQTHIQIAPRNPVPGGKDFIIGDVHGGLDAFTGVQQNLAIPGDRLFIAGDMVDRGEGSVEVVRRIVENNAKKGKGKIYCVRGNHEDMCVNAIGKLSLLTEFKFSETYEESTLLCLYALKLRANEDDRLRLIMENKVIQYFLGDILKAGEKIYKKTFGDDDISAVDVTKNLDVLNLTETYANLQGEMTDLAQVIFDYEYNGGEWLLKLFLEELSDKQKKITVNDKCSVEFSESSDIKMISDFLGPLPYIIHVEAEIPFNVVHADMPFSDEVLIARVLMNMGMTEEEIEYATWARKQGSHILIRKLPGRDAYTYLVYVGHSINDNVRADTNTINLDVGAWYNKITLMVNHSDLKCYIVNETAHVDHDELIKIKMVLAATQLQLDKQKLLTANRFDNKLKAVEEKRIKESTRNNTIFTRKPADKDMQAAKRKLRKWVRNKPAQ